MEGNEQEHMNGDFHDELNRNLQSFSDELRALKEDDEIDVAFAAHAAAVAMSESDIQAAAAESNVPALCRICGRGDEESRPLIRFLPVPHDIAAANASPMVDTFCEDIFLHVFCGKTASILPTVNQPELEILTKAGLKNKHGIGPEVNAALARSRCAILAQEGVKEKQFYLVREFEAHLAAIRHTRITYSSGALQDALQADAHDLGDAGIYGEEPLSPSSSGPANDIPYSATPPSPKLLPIRASAGIITKPHRRYAEETMLLLTPEGKMRCACGGSHLPTDTTRGVQSWRTHVLTKRHQKWMEENGMLTTV